MTTHNYGPELEAAVKEAGWQDLEFDPEVGVLTADDGDSEGCRLFFTLWVNTNECSVTSEEWETEKTYPDQIPNTTKAQQDLFALYRVGDQEKYDDYSDEDMDGDFGSAMASAGFGTDESYGSFGSEDDF